MRRHSGALCALYILSSASSAFAGERSLTIVNDTPFAIIGIGFDAGRANGPLPNALLDKVIRPDTRGTAVLKTESGQCVYHIRVAIQEVSVRPMYTLSGTAVMDVSNAIDVCAERVITISAARLG